MVNRGLDYLVVPHGPVGLGLVFTGVAGCLFYLEVLDLGIICPGPVQGPYTGLTGPGLTFVKGIPKKHFL